MRKAVVTLFILIAAYANAQNGLLESRLIADSIHLSKKQSAASFLLKKYRERPNIYLNDSKENLDAIKRLFPEEIKSSIEVADQVRDRYFLFRYDWDMEKTNVPYRFSKKIDWKAIPFGDEEWCFMLNRHRYWIDLGRAYKLTGKEKYAQTWVRQITDWIKENPVDDESLRRLSWRRIEAGIRCENWIKTFEYVKHSNAVTPQFMELFLNALYDHAEYLNDSFTDFSLTSNWGVLEFHGLLNAAVFLSDFEKADEWRQDAIYKLTECSKIQVLPDGTQWEQSPMYHNEVFHCYLNTAFLSKKTGFELPEVLLDNTRKLAMANVKWQKPNKHQPLIGDSDDTNLSGLLTTAALFLNDANIKFGAFETLDYDNYFVSTLEEQQAYNAMEAIRPDFESIYLSSSGNMIMRSGWGADDNYMHFKAKRLADGHEHDDLLHISLYGKERDYLVDGGRYTYVDSPERELFKSSETHNLLAVDNQPNSIYLESWGNSYNASSEAVYINITDKFDYADAINNAYLRLDDPVLMQRRVVYIKPGLWLLFDSFNAKKEHSYTQYFHFADKSLRLSGDEAVTTYDEDNLVLRAIKPVESSLKETFYSPEYNLMKENYRVEFVRNGSGFDSFITALYFTSDVDVNIEKLKVYNRKNEAYSDGIAEALRINYGDKEYLLLVVHQMRGDVTPFYKVDGNYMQGEVVLLEKTGKSGKHYILKD